jgi:hypothetical protein
MAHKCVLLRAQGEDEHYEKYTKEQMERYARSMYSMKVFPVIDEIKKEFETNFFGIVKLIPLVRMKNTQSL